MHGNRATRSLRAISEMILYPRDGWRWSMDKIHRQSPIGQGLPWMSYKVIDYLDTLNFTGKRVFEWGGGGSTLYFLSKNCYLTTIESSADWAALITSKVQAYGVRENYQLRVIDAETGRREHIDQYVNAIDDREFDWDLVVVDGLEESYLSRVECVRKAVGAVAPGGMLILDDAWRKEYSIVPEILRGWSRMSFKGLGPARYGVTQTDVYTYR